MGEWVVEGASKQIEFALCPQEEKIKYSTV